MGVVRWLASHGVMRMAKLPTAYQSYLLRLWKETDEATWRASLDSTETGERLGFESVDVLCNFLKMQTIPYAIKHATCEQPLMVAPPRASLTVTSKPRKAMTTTPRRKTM
jgi:hypothetical protein